MNDRHPPDDRDERSEDDVLLGPPDGDEYVDEAGFAHMEVGDPYEVPPQGTDTTMGSVGSTPSPLEPSGDAAPGSMPGSRGSRVPSRRRWGLTSLFRPVDVERPGTMPAGVVLAVVVVGLVLAALLNADATLRKSQASGDGFRQRVAAVVADVSGTLRLSVPRNVIDSAMGRSVGDTKGLDELLAEKEDTLAKKEDAIDPAVTTSTTAPGPPVLRTPTPDDPLKMYIGGDSVLGSMGVQLQPIADSTGLFTPTLDYRVGTGLVRPNYFNWPQHLVQDIIPSEDPDVMVLMFGANDDQNIELENGDVLTKYTAEWYAEYRKRVGGLMDLLESADHDRQIVWVGSSPNGPGSNIANQDVLNYIYWSEAQSRPWVTFVDTFAFLGWDSFAFEGDQTNADGVRRNMYQNDNLHLATTGAQRLAWGIIRHLGEILDLSAAERTAPPSQSAPDDVVERDTLPKPATDTGG